MPWNDFFNDPEYIMALPLADRVHGVNRIIGSASFVMPGVFLTAKHMLEQYLWEHEHIDITARDWEPRDLNVGFEMDVLHIMKDRKLLAWHIGKVHHVPNTDVAILVARGYTGGMEPDMIRRSARAKIDLHFPLRGSRITSLGYPMTSNLTEEGTTRTWHNLNLRKTTGVVEDIDASSSNLSRSPRLQTNAKVDGGMSGGPVFNPSGVMFGVNSTAMPPTEEHDFYSSFATPLFMAMVVKMRLKLEGANEETETTLADLAREGHLEIIGLEHFVYDAEGNLMFDTRNFRCSNCPRPRPR